MCRGLESKLACLMWEGCSGATLREEMLEVALDGRTDVGIAWNVIADASEAARAGLHGSPTMLVDGVDPFAAPGQPPSLSCRLYDNAPGLLERAPSVTRLRQVLGAAAGPGRGDG